MFEVKVVVVVVGGANGLPPCGLTLLCPNLWVWGFGVVVVCLFDTGTYGQGDDLQSLV